MRHTSRPPHVYELTLRLSPAQGLVDQASAMEVEESGEGEASALMDGPAFGGDSCLSYGDEKVANREIGVWHGATDKGP
jgi:hypothetical protein